MHFGQTGRMIYATRVARVAVACSIVVVVVACVACAAVVASLFARLYSDICTQRRQMKCN